MTFRITLVGKPPGKVLRDNGRKLQKQHVKALTLANRQAARDIKREGDRDIRRAGNFGARWTDSFFAEPVPKSGGYTDKNSINVGSTIPYFHIHEDGGTIRGKPLLWIPLSFTGLVMRAREYGRRYGLFRVDRKGGKAPLLLSIRDKQPKYFGAKSVRIPKRFHIKRICRGVMRGFGKLYRDRFKAKK